MHGAHRCGLSIAHTEARFLPELATTKLRMRGLTANGVMAHFVTRTRRASKLIDRWNGITSGGPIRLLDLDCMRRNAAAAAAAQWLLWQRVVAGTKPAQPFWWFADKHAADPRRYALERARTDYLAGPRVLAMTAFNALPHGLVELPTSALEALQAGYGTYVNLAWLTAVPADGLAPAHGEHGGWLTACSERLADQLAYLTAAHPPQQPAPRCAARRGGHPGLTPDPPAHRSATAAPISCARPHQPTPQGGTTMTIRLSFDLSAVQQLAEHAIAAVGHLHPAGCTTTGPALLLSSGSNGVHLTSNGVPAPRPTADQPGTVSRPAVFAHQCSPATPGWNRSRCCAAKPNSPRCCRCANRPATR